MVTCTRLVNMAAGITNWTQCITKKQQQKSERGWGGDRKGWGRGGVTTQVGGWGGVD